MKRHGLSSLIGILLWAALTVAAPSQGVRERLSIPPQRAGASVPFRIPQDGESVTLALDEPWQYVQTLLDVDTTQSGYAAYLNALPVGMDFTHRGRGFLATLHTVFRTTDGGRTWRNMDPYPPPNTRSSDFLELRSPVYLTAMDARHVARDSVQADSILFTASDVDTDSGFVRLIYYLSTHRLYPQMIAETPNWLTCLAVSDSTTGIAIAGLDGAVYENDSLWTSVPWEDLSPDKVLIRAGRSDSLIFTDSWISQTMSFHRFVMAVGSHRWISRDGGAHWTIRPAADSLYDNAVSFCDSTYGLTGGGRLTPQSEGWVHLTTNSGQSWSGRVLQTPLPIRAVAMVTPQICFAAGGNYQNGTGKVWGSTDGGQNWSEVLSVSAEIKVLKAIRIDNAYLDVFAAGVYPDLRGGIWRTRIYSPDTTLAVVVCDPDSLDFGTHAVGERDTLTVLLRNIGQVGDSITGFASSSPSFSPLWTRGRMALNPGQQDSVQIAYFAQYAGTNAGLIRVNTQRSGLVEIYCQAVVPAAADPRAAALPQAPTLTISPNPGNAMFTLRYDIPRAGALSLRIFDLNGRLIDTLHDGPAAAGSYSQPWNAADYPSGIYFVRLHGAQHTLTQKLLLIK
jgi:hypothetical protein